jgi:hypothetical protein
MNCTSCIAIPLLRVVLAMSLAAASACAAAQAVPAPQERDDAILLAQRAVDQAQRMRDEAMRQADEALQRADAELASLDFASRELGGPREIVKNAPYTAEAVTETTQVLMDGNRIVRKSATLLARDSVGRTRQEKKGDHGGTIYIYDPLESRSYVLRTAGKTAVSLPRVAQVPLPPTPPVPPAPPDAAVSVQPGRVIVRSSHGGTDERDVQVEVVRIVSDDSPGAADVAVAPLPPMPPLFLHGHALPLPERTAGKGVTETLGTRDFDGVKAEGKRTTRTIPAGAIGNEKPIAIVSERWFSPELNVVVLSRNLDPRSGETVYRLTNVKRGEPPADLFKVPADYKLRDEERSPRRR